MTPKPDSLQFCNNNPPAMSIATSLRKVPHTKDAFAHRIYWETYTSQVRKVVTLLQIKWKLTIGKSKSPRLSYRAAVYRG
jgi:hypothetical protein